MWARAWCGQEFARLERKEKYENIYHRNPGRDGYNRLSARIQSPNRSAKTGASDGDASSSLKNFYIQDASGLFKVVHRMI